MPDGVLTLDNESTEGHSRRVCTCKKRALKRRHVLAVSLIVALHYSPLARCFNYWRGARDETIFPSKNIKGRLLCSGAYVCQGDQSNAISPADHGVSSFYRVQIPIDNELTSHQGYYLAQPNSQEKPTLLWLHNTNENVGMLIPSLCDVFNKLGVNIVCVDMRGMGTCEGIPTSATMAEDARRITRYIVKKLGRDCAQKIDPSQIYVFGHGLAAHAALETASHPEVRDLVQGAILSNPLPSILSSIEARETLAPNYWLRAYYPDRFDNIESLQNCNRKLLVIGNSDDKTLNQIVGAAKYSPHHIALIGGLGIANSLDKLDELPQSFVDLLKEFLNNRSFDNSQKQHSFFESANFPSEEFSDSAEAPGVCSTITTSIKDRINSWNEYLHSSIGSSEDEMVVKESKPSLMCRVRGLFSRN